MIESNRFDKSLLIVFGNEKDEKNNFLSLILCVLYDELGISHQTNFFFFKNPHQPKHNQSPYVFALINIFLSQLTKIFLLLLNDAALLFE